MKIKAYLYKLNDYPLIAIISVIYIIHFFYSTNLVNNNELLSSFLSRTDKFLRAFEFLLFMIYFYLYKIDKKYLFYFMTFVFIFFIIKKFSNSHLSFHLFFIPLFLSQFIRRSKLCSILLIISVISFSIVFIGYFYGLFKSDLYSRNGLIRYSLGFLHPNTLGFIVLTTSFLLFLRYQVVRIIDIVFVTVSIVFLYYVPRSMTPVFLLLLLLGFQISIYFYKAKFDALVSNNRIKNVLFYFLVLIVILTIFFTYFISFTNFGKNIFLDMPGSIWARFELGRVAYEKYGFSLFGTPIESVFPDPIRNITEYFVVDCAYFFIPINYGVVSFVLYIFMILTLLRKASFSGDYKLIFVLLLIVFSGVSEVYIFSPILIPIFSCAFCSDENIGCQLYCR